MESLYQKYRPNRFSELIGQKEISQTLSNAIALNKVFHSYLFYGPRGCGKTSTARILAKALNCHARKGVEPCNECISCREISSSSSVDVIEIDAASHTQVQNIRDVIIDSVGLSCARDKYKIYILDEVHMLSSSAFNALLKTIEEPPPHVVFILATTEINKVPLTIISRCQTFRFKPVPEDEIMRRLIEICKLEGINYEEQAISLIVKSSGGAMRDALSLLEKISSFCSGNVDELKTREILGYPAQHIVKELASAVLLRDVKMINSVFNDIKREGYDVVGILKEMRDMFSKSFLAANGLYSGKDIIVFDVNPFIFPKLARKINKIIEEIRYSDNAVLLAEVFIYTIIDTVDIEKIIKNLQMMKDIVESNKEKDDDAKKVVIKGESSTSNEVSTSDFWKKVCEHFMKENYQIYNILISSEVYFEGNDVYITPPSEIELNILKNHTQEILSCFSKFKMNLHINKKKIDNPPPLFVKKDIYDDELEFNFPELERIKKVFGNSIMRIIKNEVSAKIDR